MLYEGEGDMLTNWVGQKGSSAFYKGVFNENGIQSNRRVDLPEWRLPVDHEPERSREFPSLTIEQSKTAYLTMSTTHQPAKRMILIGWILSGLAIALLLADSIGKLIKPEQVIQSTLELGYPERVLTGLGVVLLIATLLYAIPNTSFLGAILLTGYLGGAVATHVRLGSPLFSHVLFPVYIGLVIWIGLYLRNEWLKQLVLAGWR